MIQMLMAVVRSRASRNMLRMSERVDGAMVAPATPNTARETINIAALRENAARIDAAPNRTAPIKSSRRRPMRSPSVPIVMSEPASRNP